MQNNNIGEADDANFNFGLLSKLPPLQNTGQVLPVPAPDSEFDNEQFSGHVKPPQEGQSEESSSPYSREDSQGTDSDDDESKNSSHHWLCRPFIAGRKRLWKETIRLANVIVGEHPQNLNFFASTNSTEKMDEVPREEVQLFNRIIEAIQKLYIAACVPQHILYQYSLGSQILSVVLAPDKVPKYGSEVPSQGTLAEMTYILIAYTTMVVLIVSLFVVCIKCNKPRLIELILVIIYIRNLLVFLNFEHRHLYMEAYQLQMLQNVVNMTLIFTQVMLYLSLRNSQHIPFIVITSFSYSLGCLMYQLQQSVSLQAILDHFSVYITFTVQNVIAHLFIRYFYLFIKQQFLNFLMVKVGLHKEIMSIIENLEVALITRNESGGMGFCNLLGFKMLQNIWKDMSPQQSELDLSQRQNILHMSGWIKKGGLAASSEEKKIEKRVLRAKVFRVYKPPSEGEVQEPQPREATAYSMEDIFHMSPDHLKDLVFWVLKKYHDNSELARDLFSSPRQQYRVSDFGEIKYVQIKKQTFTGKNGIAVHDVLQIVDISDQVMCNKATAEKKLLTLINATVSHEMRNPTNSIHCQNLLQRQLNSSLNDLLSAPKLIGERKLKKRIKVIQEQLSDSVGIQESSTNLLRFLVSDILDFAQIQSGKFRKNPTLFSLSKAIDDVVNIMKYKADQQSLGIVVQIERGDSPVFECNPSADIVSMDEHRLQQIVLNLLSNSLKFTPAGKQIYIRVRRLFGVQDLRLAEFAGNQQVGFEDLEERIKKANHGCLQISIEDEGIGISAENQGKLFKLFGFMDEREGLNAHGIGLGLHISKRIVQEFGGEIACVSEKDNGCKFIFLLPLSPTNSEGRTKLSRCRNPIEYDYAKITLRPPPPHKAREPSPSEKKKILRSQTLDDLPSILSKAKKMSLVEPRACEHHEKPIVKKQKKKPNLKIQPPLTEIQEEQQIHARTAENTAMVQPIGHKRVSTFAEDAKNLHTLTPIIAHCGESVTSLSDRDNDEGFGEYIQRRVRPRSALKVASEVVNFTLNLEIGESSSSASSIGSQRRIQFEPENEDSTMNHLQTGHRQSCTSVARSVNYLRNRRILIVDDEPYNIIGLTIVLQQSASQIFGAAVAEPLTTLIDRAANGQEAINAVRQAYYDGDFSYGLILMDCSMPVLDGYQATEAIRTYARKKNQEQPRIVACTGHVEEEFIRKAFRSGMDEVVGKPASIDLVKEVLKDIIEI